MYSAYLTSLLSCVQRFENKNCVKLCSLIGSASDVNVEAWVCWIVVPDLETIPYRVLRREEKYEIREVEVYS